MRVLVFGKTGQVARELQHFDGVIALSRADADLSDPTACAAIIAQTDADVVINAAAYTGVDGAETDTDMAFRINSETPKAMADALQTAPRPFFISRPIMSLTALARAYGVRMTPLARLVFMVRQNSLANTVCARRTVVI